MELAVEVAGTDELAGVIDGFDACQGPAGERVDERVQINHAGRNGV